MNLNDKLIKIYFVNTPVELIFGGGVSGEKFPAERLVELLRCYHQEYSDTEARLIATYHLHETEGQNVFRALIGVAEELLSVRENRVCCRYESILRWREISREVGESLLVCAYLAGGFQKNKRQWRDFGWSIVLGHNHKQLNAIMREGISDNHFHLFGSAPVFPMIWQRMMNDVSHGKYLVGLMGIDWNRRHFQYTLGGMREHYSISVLLMQAMLMRAICIRHYKWKIKFE